MKRTTIRQWMAAVVSVCLLATIGLLGGCKSSRLESGQVAKVDTVPPEATDFSGAGQELETIANLQKPDMIIYYGQETTLVYKAGTEELEQVFALNQARQRDKENEPVIGLMGLPKEISESMPIEFEGSDCYLEYVYTSTDYAPVLFTVSKKEYTDLVTNLGGTDYQQEPFGHLKPAEELLAYIDSTMA